MNRYLAKLRAVSQENHHISAPSKPSKPSFEGFEGNQSSRISAFGGHERNARYSHLISALKERCPEFAPSDRWQQAIRDAETFLGKWGEKAHVLGWTGQELFGLHPVPEHPSANYSRLSRYDETGLVWLLQGRPVVALTEESAAIQNASSILTYRKLNKPALGPLGDTLDDFR
jgi:hypothetical protein